MNLKVLIADDHPIFRKGLKQVIESSDSMSVVSEASDGAEAVAMNLRTNPDVIVLDVEMPELSGLDAARKILEEDADKKIIILTMYKEEDMFNEALDLGIMAYVLKENAAENIIDAVISAAAGNYYITPSISDYLIKRNNRVMNLKKEKPGMEKLTNSERNILRLISQNKTSKEIADELYISYKTVENHRVNISKKLGLHGTHALLKFALGNKMNL